MKHTLTELRQVLNYAPETGVFTWLVSMPPRGIPGGSAGTFNKAGYRMIAVKGERMYAHRLAWLFVHGVWPSSCIDHVNGERSDNRIANLRVSSMSQNIANARCSINSTTGFKGVSRKRKRWASRIVKNGIVHRLGVYDTPQEAHSAYVAKARELFGEFARAA